MKWYVKNLLLVLAAVSAAQAFNELVPKGKELIYTYTGEISAGTKIPQNYESQMLVQGKLHVQLEGNGIVAQLSDVSYKLYNGKVHYGHTKDLHSLPLPDEAHDLLRPFKISYNSNGQLKSLSMEKDEKMFARNMHRAIAAVLQMDCKKVNIKSNYSHAFRTTEQNLYGKSVTEYNVYTEKDELIVQKMHEMESTSPIYLQGHTNIDFDYCEAQFEEPMFHDSQQKYCIKKKEYGYVADYIETTGSFRLHPYQALSEDFSVSVKVSLDLIDCVPITNTRSRKSEQTEHDIYYRMYDVVDKDKIDLTNGRYTVDMDKLVSLIEEVLCQMAQYLHDPLNEKDASVAYALELLKYCDVPALERIATILLEKSPNACEIFHQILPYIGSHASVMFIKNIIVGKKVKDYVAVQILAEFPGYVRNPTEALLKDVEELLTCGDDVDEQVRRTAVLSFASLLYHTYRDQVESDDHEDHSSMMSNDHHILRYNIHGHKKYNSFSDRIKSFFKGHDIFDTYISKFAKMIHDSKDIATQVLGVQALFNTKSPAIIDHLLPIAKGEKHTDIMLRVWSLWMVSHVAFDNSEFLFNHYWPVVTDCEEPIEVRVVAYYVLVQSHPTLTRLLNIHHFLEQEIDSELYYVHYSYIWVMSRTSDPCHYVTQMNAKKILKNALVPTYKGYSHYYQADYMNSKYKYGEEVNYIYTGSAHGGMFKWEYNVQLANKRYNPYTIYVRIEGVDDYVLDRFRMSLNSTEGLFNYDRVVDLFASLCLDKDVVVFIDRSNNKRMTHSIVLKGSDLTNVDHIWNILRSMGLTFGDNRVHVQMSERTIIPFPTEMGLPVVFESIAPSINRYSVNMHKNEDDNFIMHFDNHYYFSNRLRYSLAFYNPLSDNWQGVGKYHAVEYQFPFYADLTLNPQQGNMKLSLKKYEKEYKDAIAMNLNTKTKIDLDDYIAEVEANTDRYWATNLFKEWQAMFSSNYHKNQNNLWDYVRLSYFNWYHILFRQPSPTSTKLSLVLAPNPKYKNVQTDINARFKETVTQENSQFLPGLKYNFRISTACKNKDEVLKTTDLHFTTDLNCGHTHQYTKLDFSFTIPTSKKEYKFCFEDDARWTLSDVSGNATITIEDSDHHSSNVFDITYVGKPLPEQENPVHAYGDCLAFVDTGVTDFSSMQCLAAHTSLRHFVYKVKSKSNMNALYNGINKLVNFYHHYYHTGSVINSDMPDNEMIVTMSFPTRGLGMDLTYETKYRVHKFKEIPHYISSPSNTHTSKLHTFLQENYLTQQCHADANMITQDLLTKKPIKCLLAEYWTLYVGDSDGSCDHGVFLRRIPESDLMAFKALHGGRSLEIHPCGDNFEKFKFIVDGTEITNKMDYYSCDWFTYLYRESSHEVIINTLHFYFSIRFNGRDIDISIPRVEGFKFYGKCIA
ncbi:hypothetical protein FQR65_LT04610 [Abscondita terminalis]|nr:hypothetical protein FQR65_LT04610 [Abscondita terminalis]